MELQNWANIASATIGFDDLIANLALNFTSAGLLFKTSIPILLM